MGKIVQYTDDYTGDIRADIIADFRFSIGNDRYAIDISPETEAKMREAMAPFIKAARIIMTGKSPVIITPPNETNGNGHQDGKTNGVVIPDTEPIRKWAVDTGIPVKPNGRIAVSLVDAFKKANQIPA